MRRLTILGFLGAMLGSCGGSDAPGSIVGSGGSASRVGSVTGGFTSGGLTSGVTMTGGAPAGGGPTYGGTSGTPGTGGLAAGGHTGGGSATGGASTGGAATGGAATGGVVTGGRSAAGGTKETGGSATGGLAQGGSTTGGAAAGGSSFGGTAAGGATGAGGMRPAGGNSATGGGPTGGGASTGGGGGGPSSLLVPDQGALLGAFVGTGTFDQLETTLGRKLSIIHTFVGWSDDYTTRLAGDFGGGRIPLITWETWNNQVGVPLDDIIAGNHDSMIRARAEAAKGAGQRFFLRWGHEMNGNWYPWDGSHNGGNAAATAKYITAYRHIHDIFSSAGASNVLWVFSPNVDSVPGDAWNQWSNYYPGDSYVDWLAFDGYNWGTVQSGSSWQSFPTIAGRIYSSLAAKGKPIMIPETSSTEQGGDKSAWIAGILPALKASFPAIKALVWFHMNKETDWRIDSSPGARTSFVAMANDPYFNP